MPFELIEAVRDDPIFYAKMGMIAVISIWCFILLIILTQVVMPHT